VEVAKVLIAIGCDHAGLNLKKGIKEYFKDKGVIFKDFGVETDQSVDYPDIALVVAESVASEESSHGILVCGTGIGMVMAANKVPGIRAALCHDTFTARAAKEHNDANVLTLGERVTGPGLAGRDRCTPLQRGRFLPGPHAFRSGRPSEMGHSHNRRASAP
jgi:ribose 5-phosphate isomerase B